MIISGSPWTEEQLFGGEPIFNKRDFYRAGLVLVVDTRKDGEEDFYLAPPDELERVARARALEFAKRPKRDGTPRSIGFRKELPRAAIQHWRAAWHLLGKPLRDKPSN